MAVASVRHRVRCRDRFGRRADVPRFIRKREVRTWLQAATNACRHASRASAFGAAASRPGASGSPMLALTQLSNYLTLKGSFSAVSKPNFARKYAFESSRRDLQNALLCTPSTNDFCSTAFSVLEESGQVYFSCARIPGSLLFFLFFEKDWTTLLACLLRYSRERAL